MRIALLIRSLEIGGAEVQLVALARGLHRAGEQVSVITFYPGGALESSLAEDGIPVICAAKGGRWDLLGFGSRLWRVLRRLRPDVLHTFLGGPNLFGAALKPLLPARLVWGVRASDMDLSRYDWTWRAMFRVEAWLSRLPSWILSNSLAGRDFVVSKGFRGDRLSVIPNGIDTVRFHPDRRTGVPVRASWNVAPGAALVGLVARLDPMKDHFTFLEAAALLRQRLPAVRFVCAGGGAESYALQLRNRAAQLQIDDAVVWAGERRDIPAVLNALDVPTLSSITEGFPNALCEAMACGLPCVTTDVGDAGAIVGDTGFVVPRRNPQALADAWERTLRLSPAQRTALGQRARRRIEQYYSLDAMISQTVALYRELSASAAARVAETA